MTGSVATMGRFLEALGNSELPHPFRNDLEKAFAEWPRSRTHRSRGDKVEIGGRHYVRWTQVLPIFALSPRQGLHRGAPVEAWLLQVSALFLRKGEVTSDFQRIPEVRIECLETATGVSDSRLHESLIGALADMAETIGSSIVSAFDELLNIDEDSLCLPASFVFGLPAGMEGVAKEFLSKQREKSEGYTQGFVRSIYDDGVEVTSISLFVGKELEEPKKPEKRRLISRSPVSTGPGQVFLLVQFKPSTLVLGTDRLFHDPRWNECAESFRNDGYPDFVIDPPSWNGPVV